MQMASEETIYFLTPNSELIGIRFAAIFGDEAITLNKINRFVFM